MENTVRQRIVNIFKEYDTNPSKFSGEDSAMQKRLSRQLNGGASITFETLSSILIRYPNVSSEWLFRGEGEMLKREHNYMPIDDSTIYHYTDIEGLFKIVETLTLKFSDLSKSNDLKERSLYKKLLSASGYDKNKAIETLRENKTISFCQEVTPLNNFRKFDHPRMWSQYGGAHKGACIAINRDSLERQNDICISYSKIKYDKLGYIDKDKSIDDELNSKHVDWEQEQEIRIKYKGKCEFLDIEGCIETIYLGYDFNNFEALSRLIYNSNLVCYKKVTPFSFSKVVDRDGIIYGERSPSVLVPREMFEYANEDYRKWMIQSLGLSEDIFDNIEILQISPESISGDGIKLDINMDSKDKMIEILLEKINSLEKEIADLRRKYEPTEERRVV